MVNAEVYHRRDPQSSVNVELLSCGVLRLWIETYPYLAHEAGHSACAHIES